VTPGDVLIGACVVLACAMLVRQQWHMLRQRAVRRARIELAIRRMAACPEARRAIAGRAALIRAGDVSALSIGVHHWSDTP
jgi:hypothetical protein